MVYRPNPSGLERPFLTVLHQKNIRTLGVEVTAHLHAQKLPASLISQLMTFIPTDSFLLNTQAQQDWMLSLISGKGLNSKEQSTVAINYRISTLKVGDTVLDLSFTAIETQLSVSDLRALFSKIPASVNTLIIKNNNLSQKIQFLPFLFREIKNNRNIINIDISNNNFNKSQIKSLLQNEQLIPD